MLKVPMGHSQLADSSKRVRKGYASRLVAAVAAGRLKDVPDPTGILTNRELMGDVDVLARTGVVSERLMIRLVISLGSTKLTTAGDEEGVKLLRLIDPSAIEHGGLSAAFRAKANRYDVGSFLKEFVADARLIEVARKQLDREKRVADAVVAAAVAAAETAREPASLEEAIVADERAVEGYFSKIFGKRSS